jgi:beta-N-acetylhexosaminidase
MNMALGPIMVDIFGTELLPEERDRLRHPLVGGVILFSRNYESPEQLQALTRTIHEIREPQLLIAVDHEGGRVQRFKSAFTALPPARRLGELHDENPKRAIRLARTAGWLMASELRSIGVDLSFAPVLDLDRGIAAVIGDRAFHRNPEVVATLANAYTKGMNAAGMAATGKHFPGHGGCNTDSHLAVAVDDRSYADVEAEDMVPFERMSHFGVAAIMAAHVIFPKVDGRPAGFSRWWLTDVLRRKLEFQGVIFSDDLSMAGAHEVGDMLERTHAALDAGVDMALICNDTGGLNRVLDQLGSRDDPASRLRLVRLHGRPAPDRMHLASNSAYQDAARAVENFA